MSIVAYLVRHGEVEHHRSDVSITARGRSQAAQAGAVLADRIAPGDEVIIRHSPVRRVVETAELIRSGLAAALTRTGRADRVALAPLETHVALSNVRFILGPGREPEEPSLLYTQLSTPEFLQTVPAARADFYRGFWTSADPMGYWLSRDSAGAAETPEIVVGRLLRQLGEVLAAGPNGAGRTHWIGVTHSGAMRAVLRRAFGADPGEPDFCAIITFERAAAPDRATLSYLDRRAELSLAAD